MIGTPASVMTSTAPRVSSRPCDPILKIAGIPTASAMAEAQSLSAPQWSFMQSLELRPLLTNISIDECAQ